MPKYRVLLNGRNFILRTENGPKREGFYQTHWIEAADEEQAELAAVQKVRESKDLQSIVLNKLDDPPRIFLDEIEEVENFDHVIANPEGRGYYPEVRWWEVWRPLYWAELWDRLMGRL